MAGWGKRRFKHHLYKGRVIITSGLNMFKPLGGPTLLNGPRLAWYSKGKNLGDPYFEKPPLRLRFVCEPGLDIGDPCCFADVEAGFRNFAAEKLKTYCSTLLEPKFGPCFDISSRFNSSCLGPEFT